MDEPGAAAWWVSFLTRLPRYKYLLRKRWWIPAVTVATGLLAAAWYVATQPVVYKSTAKLMVGGKLSIQENATYYEEATAFLGTQIEWMRSEEVQSRAAERVLAVDPGIKPVPVKLDAEIIRNTTIFVLTAIGSDPDYTTKYLRACVDEYMDARKGMRSEKSELALSQLTDQLQQFDKEAREADEELVAFEKENSVGGLQEESAGTAAYLAKLNGQLADLKTEYNLLDLLNIDQTLEHNQKGKPGDDSSSGIPGGDTVKSANGAEVDYLKARQEIELLKARRDELSKLLRPKHPDMIQLNQDIAREETLIGMFRSQTLDQLKSHKESLALQIKNIEGSIAEWQGKSQVLNGKMAEYNRIKAREARAKASYDWIQTSARSIDVDSKIDQEIVSPMSQASPAVPVRPNLLKLICLGLLGGALAGLSILFMLDKIDDRMNSFGEFQSHFDESVLAKIPAETAAETILAFNSSDDRPSFLESMRALRSSIYYLPVEGHPPKTFLITSAVPNEGKTTIAVNLAVTMGFAGAKTLLVDGDLRRGSMHEKFGMDNSVGVGDVFKGRVGVEQAARPTKVANLWLMSRGANLEHPGENYLGNRADELLTRVYDQYDAIIFDSSPVLVADDTTSLAPKIDATIFVVRFSFSSARRSREAIELLRKRQVNLIGVVCNGVDQMMKDYYYNKYPEYYAVKHDA